MKLFYENGWNLPEEEPPPPQGAYGALSFYSNALKRLPARLLRIVDNNFIKKFF